MDVPRRTRASGHPATSALALERELARFTAYHRTGDPRLRAQLIEEHLPLARYVARRSHRGREPMEDLVQVAALGLVRAVDRFDPERGTTFASFAVPTIVGEIKRHFRDRGWFVRVPRQLQERALAAERESERLRTSHGRSPTIEELAQALDLSVEETLDARMAQRAQFADSLDTPGQDGEERGLERVLGREDAELRRAEDSADLGRLIRILSDRDREILLLRFRDGLTRREIADRVGLSQMHVSRLLRTALERLQEAAADPRSTTLSPA
jgi:RNA polymerase sigma-B factor